jgi:drug/metabolite transporter (DMT)-like permease
MLRTMTTDAPAVQPGTHHRVGVGVTAGITAQTFVGGSVAVSALLIDAPLFAAQAVRYAVAFVLLLLIARAIGRTLVLPRGREWWWFTGVVVTGLIVFNIALVRGADHAEPAVYGVAVACVPIALALLGPWLQGHAPSRRVVVAAFIVTAGAALVQGAGRADAIGIALAVVVLVCEAAFTLMALPLLPRHGAWGVSIHTMWLAAGAFGVLGLATEGPRAFVTFDREEWLALAYLVVLVTMAAFVLWYSTVHRLGAARAGLLTAIAPISAAAVGIALGAGTPSVLVWAGIAVIAIGLAVGLRPTGQA